MMAFWTPRMGTPPIRTIEPRYGMALNVAKTAIRPPPPSVFDHVGRHLDKVASASAARGHGRAEAGLRHDVTVPRVIEDLPVVRLTPGGPGR